MSSSILKQINKLFLNKQYNEVISVSEDFIKSNAPTPFLLNLIGLCKILISNKKDEDLISALSYFEKSHLLAKDKIEGLDGLINLIRACILNINNFKLNKEIFYFLKKAKKLYLNAEKYFGENENFLIFGSDLFKYLLDQNKQNQILDKLINLGTESKVIRSRYLFDNNYLYNWSQKDHFDKAIENSSFFKKLETKNVFKAKDFKNKKIKLGLVCSDLRSYHPLTFFIKRTFQYLDKKNFITSVFSLAKRNKDDPSQNELIQHFNNWHDLHSYNNQQVVDFIQDKEIDILIDIMGFTSANRIQIFNSRVAPTQISWLAYCNTLGFDNIDYLIADHNLIHKKEEKFYSEKIIKLPEIWNAHSGFDIKRNLIKSPFNKNNFLTFGSFGNFKKISDEVVDSWSSILKKINGSKLILKSSINFDTENLMKKFKKRGIDDQIKIYNRLDFNDISSHLDLYNEVDIALDTFPYNGVTTTFEALWKGVPVITMKGFNFNSRCGESIIKNSGFNFLACSNQKEYVEKAIYFAKNKNELNKLREEIFKKILDTPLFNTKKFALEFGKILKKIN